MPFIERLSEGWRAWALLFVLTVAAAAPGVFALPPLDRDESRFAQASKQMLETGDFIQIRYQDEGRNKKPAGIHWLQAGSTAVFSSPGANEIWSYRLPSLLGAALASIAVFWCGIPLIGRAAAFAGAGLFSTGLLITSEAHIAKTDAVLAALTIWGIGCAARLFATRHPSRPLRLALTFWIAMAGAFLIKGPVGPMVAGFAIIGASAWTGRWSWIKPLGDWRGWLVFVLLTLPWFVWVQWATSGDYLEGAVGKDLKDKLVSASEGHGGLPGFHLAHVVTHFFPATLFLIPALAMSIPALRSPQTPVAERDGLKFLASWAALTWIFFELLPTKLSHYVLPAYPALALICGWGVVRLTEGARPRISKLASGIVFAIGLGAAAALSTPIVLEAAMADAASEFSSAAPSWDLDDTWAIMVPGLVIGVVALGAFVLHKPVLAWIGAVLAGAAIGGPLRGIVLPTQSWVQPTVAATEAVNSLCTDSMRCDELQGLRVRAIGYAEPSLVFSAGTQTTIPPQTTLPAKISDVSEADVFLLNVEDPAGRAALNHLRAIAHSDAACLNEGPMYQALNYSNGDPVSFVAASLVAGACDGGAAR